MEAPPPAADASAESAPPAPWLDRGVGVLSLAGYVLSTSFGDPFDYLWSCHVGLLLVGIALWLPGARAAALAFLWVLIGFSLWGIDVLNGRSVDAMTLAVHGGGMAVASFALWRRGWPKGYVFWLVILGYLVLQQICRWVTPPELNVNLAFGIRAGWEGSFADYWPYLGLIVGGSSLGLFVIEFLARKVSRRSAAEAA